MVSPSKGLCVNAMNIRRPPLVDAAYAQRVRFFVLGLLACAEYPGPDGSARDGRGDLEGADLGGLKQRGVLAHLIVNIGDAVHDDTLLEGHMGCSCARFAVCESPELRLETSQTGRPDRAGRGWVQARGRAGPGGCSSVRDTARGKPGGERCRRGARAPAGRASAVARPRLRRLPRSARAGRPRSGGWRTSALSVGNGASSWISNLGATRRSPVNSKLSSASIPSESR